MIQDNDLALTVDVKGKARLITIQAGKKFETHHGLIFYDAMIGRPWGSIIYCPWATRIWWCNRVLPI